MSIGCERCTGGFMEGAPRSPAMGNVTGTRDEIKGKVEKTVGEAKEKLGETLDDPELEAEGLLEQKRGEARERLGKAKKDLAGLEED